MKPYALILPAALSLLAFAPAAAQKLEPGRWTGRVIPPGEQMPVEVTYDVTLKGDTMGITINAGEHGSFAVSEVKLEGAILSFWFTPGPRVDCTLTRREDGVFQGPCRDSDGGDASMVMIPPKKEGRP